MKRYGVLPADHPDDKPVAFRALEERYWHTFWYCPPAGGE